MNQKRPLSTFFLLFSLLLLPHPFFAQFQKEIQHSILADSGHVSHFCTQLQKETQQGVLIDSGHISHCFVPLQKETLQYAETDGEELWMDIYTCEFTTSEPRPCLIFVFGGGFKEGERDAKGYQPYYDYFARRGFAVVSIDYRLGMKGEKAPGFFNLKPLQKAIAMAVVDLYSATGYLIDHADELAIDPERIIISGSSAGAITVLQADYWKRNCHSNAESLPADFRYAGVISFAGAIFSTNGTPSYLQPPAPTLFFHGSGDRLVPYNKTRLFHLGMFGSKAIAEKFKLERYPYQFYSMEKIGHEVAEYPMREFLPEIERFIRDWVFDRSRRMVDIRYEDMSRKADLTATPANYYK